MNQNEIFFAFAKIISKLFRCIRSGSVRALHPRAGAALQRDGRSTLVVFKL